MVEELLKKYDLLHCSIISGGKVDLFINYYGEKNVQVIVEGNDERKEYEFIVDKYYETFILPKVVQRYLSKNLGVSQSKKNKKSIELKRGDNKTSLFVNDAPEYHLLIVESLIKSFKKINDFSKENKLSFINYSNSDLYMLTNIICDIAYYNTKFKKSAFMLDLNNYQDIGEDVDSKKDIRNELILNIAKFVSQYLVKDQEDLWDNVLHKLHDDPVVAEIIEKFKKIDFKETSIYTKALEYAEYEKINSYVIRNNEEAFEEATIACVNNINFFKEEYLDYWKERKIYYQTIVDNARVVMCDNFINNYFLLEVKEDNGKETLISSLKTIKEHHKEKAFLPIFDERVDEEKFFEIENENVNEEIKIGALEQAKELVEVIKERDLLKKDAEEFAKEILKNIKENNEIKKDAEKQAKLIMELQEENDKLKKMADEQAEYLIKKEQFLEDEKELREFVNSSPVLSQDIDKINGLLASISDVKTLDFAVSYPTVMSYLGILEEKIITYLSTHKNVVKEHSLVDSIETEEMYETKPVVELLDMIRNAYDTSKILIKDGRKTLINLNPVDEDTYRLVLYSVKGEDEEVMMDAFFEDYQLTNDVLEELCDIFKNDTVIVASKIDILPFDRADYLIIDNLNNALKFMGCPKELIDRIKRYI